MTIRTIGIDLGKTSVHIIGVDITAGPNLALIISGGRRCGGALREFSRIRPRRFSEARCNETAPHT